MVYGALKKRLQSLHIFIVLDVGFFSSLSFVRISYFSLKQQVHTKKVIYQAWASMGFTEETN